MEGSRFCYAHKGFYKDFPPAKITALICPYCDEPLKRGAKFCKLCKNVLLICPYCDEPLRKDVKFCSFCKEDLIPVLPKPRISHYYGKFIHLFNHSATKRMDKSFDWFFVIIFLMFMIFTLLITWDIFINISGLG